MWDKRYSDSEYAYGMEPNVFFKQVLDKVKLEGKILMAAEGEGRNAVYAAKQGLNVFAFDISVEGQKKAQQLASKRHVQIHYDVGNFEEMDLFNRRYDHAAFIYAHFPPPIRAKYYHHIGKQLNSGGYVIVEAFSKSHLEYRIKNPSVGGPGVAEMLLSIEEIREYFPDFEIVQLEDMETILTEGKYHKGKGHVLRFLGRKL